jgi:hypothetical protein
MSNIRSFSVKPEADSWLDLKCKNREVSEYINYLILNDMKKENQLDKEKLNEEKLALEKRIEEINAVNDRIDKEKSTFEKEELEKKKQIEENKIKEQEEKMKMLASLKGMDKVIEEYEKLENKEDMKWANGQVDMLRELNPENQRKIGSSDLMKFLKIKYLSKSN